MQMQVFSNIPLAGDVTAQEKGRVVKRASRSNDNACTDLDWELRMVHRVYHYATC
jgi:hypothetical protein